MVTDTPYSLSLHVPYLEEQLAKAQSENLAHIQNIEGWASRCRDLEYEIQSLRQALGDITEDLETISNLSYLLREKIGKRSR